MTMASEEAQTLLATSGPEVREGPSTTRKVAAISTVVLALGALAYVGSGGSMSAVTSLAAFQDDDAPLLHKKLTKTKKVTNKKITKERKEGTLSSDSDGLSSIKGRRGHHHSGNKHSPTPQPTYASSVEHGAKTLAEIEEQYVPADPMASGVTKQLYTSLAKVSYSKSFIFGHQNDEEKGQDFRNPDALHKESDVATATGGEEWVAMYGFNLWDAVSNHTTMQHFVKSAYMKGGVIELEWEADNPITRKKLSASDCTGYPADHILPGGSANDAWKGYLDNVVEEISSYVVDGVQIPVVLRIFHEMTGTWYWWGSDCVNSTQYINIFQYTVDYLRDAGLNNLLIVYAPAKPSTYKDEALYELYPGDDYVDIMAWDRYGTTTYTELLKADAHVIVPFADEHNKVPALAETGYYEGTMQNTYDPDWWTDSFLKPIANNEYLSRIAYAITWTNYAEECYWIPEKGDYTYDGFVHMSKSDNIIFLDDEMWTDLPYAHQIQLARKHYGWDRRLSDGGSYDNAGQHGSWRCDR